MIIIASLQHTFLLNAKFDINLIELSAILLANIDASKISNTFIICTAE